MHGRDIKSLSPPYRPCKTATLQPFPSPHLPLFSFMVPDNNLDCRYRGSSFMIPPVTLSDFSFEPVSQATPHREDSMPNRYVHLFLHPAACAIFVATCVQSAINTCCSIDSFSNLFPQQEDFLLDGSSTRFEIQPVASQSLSLPLYEVLDDREGPGSEYSAFLGAVDTSNSAASQLDSIVSDSSSSNNNLLPSLTSTATLDVLAFSEPSLGSQEQLRRNHERLRERNLRTEANYAELRRAAHGTMDDLMHVDTLVEELLNSENLSDVLYEKLSKVSATLFSAKQKLQ